MKKNKVIKRIAAGALALILAGMDFLPAMAAPTQNYVADNGNVIYGEGEFTVDENGNLIRIEENSADENSIAENPADENSNEEIQNPLEEGLTDENGFEELQIPNEDIADNESFESEPALGDNYAAINFSVTSGNQKISNFSASGVYSYETIEQALAKAKELKTGGASTVTIQLREDVEISANYLDFDEEYPEVYLRMNGYNLCINTTVSGANNELPKINPAGMKQYDVDAFLIDEGETSSLTVKCNKDEVTVFNKNVSVNDLKVDANVEFAADLQANTTILFPESGIIINDGKYKFGAIVMNVIENDIAFKAYIERQSVKKDGVYTTPSAFEYSSVEYSGVNVPQFVPQIVVSETKDGKSTPIAEDTVIGKSDIFTLAGFFDVDGDLFAYDNAGKLSVKKSSGLMYSLDTTYYKEGGYTLLTPSVAFFPDIESVKDAMARTEQYLEQGGKDLDTLSGYCVSLRKDISLTGVTAANAGDENVISDFDFSEITDKRVIFDLYGHTITVDAQNVTGSKVYDKIEGENVSYKSILRIRANGLYSSATGGVGKIVAKNGVLVEASLPQVGGNKGLEIRNVATDNMLVLCDSLLDNVTVNDTVYLETDCNYSFSGNVTFKNVSATSSDADNRIKISVSDDWSGNPTKLKITGNIKGASADGAYFDFYKSGFYSTGDVVIYGASSTTGLYASNITVNDNGAECAVIKKDNNIVVGGQIAVKIMPAEYVATSDMAIQYNEITQSYENSPVWKYRPVESRASYFESLEQALEAASTEYKDEKYTGLYVEILADWLPVEKNITVNSKFKYVCIFSEDGNEDQKYVKTVMLNDHTITVPGEIEIKAPVFFESTNKGNIVSVTKEGVGVRITDDEGFYDYEYEYPQLPRYQMLDNVNLQALDGEIVVSENNTKMDSIGFVLNSDINARKVTIGNTAGSVLVGNINADSVFLMNNSAAEINLDVCKDINCNLLSFTHDSVPNVFWQIGNINAGTIIGTSSFNHNYIDAWEVTVDKLIANRGVALNAINLRINGYGESVVKENLTTKESLFVSNGTLDLQYRTYIGRDVYITNAKLINQYYMVVGGNMSEIGSTIYNGCPEGDNKDVAFTCDGRINLRDSVIENYASFVSSIYVESAGAEIGNSKTILNKGFFVAPNITMKAGTFDNYGTAYLGDTTADTLYNGALVSNIINRSNSIIIAGKFTNTGSAELSLGSIYLQRYGAGTLNNVSVSDMSSNHEQDQALIVSVYQAASKDVTGYYADVTIGSNISGDAKSVLFKVLAPVEAQGYDKSVGGRAYDYIYDKSYFEETSIINTYGKDALFYTDSEKGFPVNIFEADGLSGNAVLSQNGKEISVKSPDFSLSDITTGATLVGYYGSWEEVVNAIDSMGDATKSYRIDVFNDVVINDSLLLPKKANNVVIDGYPYSAPQKANFEITGTIKPNTDIEFKNVRINDTSLNKFAIDGNGHNVTFTNDTLTHISSIKSSGNVSICDSTITVSDDLDVSGNLLVEVYSILTVSGNVNVSGEACVDSQSKLDVTGAIKFTGPKTTINNSKISSQSNIVINGDDVSIKGRISSSDIMTVRSFGNITIGNKKSHVEILNNAYIWTNKGNITISGGTKEKPNIIGPTDFVGDYNLKTQKGDISVLGWVKLNNASFYTEDSLIFDNIISDGNENFLSYGYHTTGQLKINGTVTSDDIGLVKYEYLSSSGEYIVTGGNPESNYVLAQKNALIVQKRHADATSGADKNNDVQVHYAPNVDTTWFVANAYNTNMVCIINFTKKSGNAHVTDSFKSETNYYVDLEKDGQLVASYETLAEAINTINFLNDSNAEYTVRIKNDAATYAKIQDYVFCAAGKAKSITIDGNNKTLYYISKLTINSDVTFKNVKLAPSSANAQKTAIILNDYKLTLGQGTDMLDDFVINTVTGKNITGNSGLKVECGKNVVINTIDKVAGFTVANSYANTTVSTKMNVKTLSLDSTLIATGTNTIGTLDSLHADKETLTVGVTPTYKDGKIVSVKPTTTITDECAPNVTLKIADKNNTVISLNDIANLADKSVKVLLAKKMATSYMEVDLGTQKYNVDKIWKIDGYVVPTGLNGVVRLVDSNGNGNETCCESVQAAVNDINNRAVSQEYTIIMEGDDRVGLKTMPNSKNVSKLTITGSGMFLVIGGNLKLTSETVFGDVYLLAPTGVSQLKINADAYNLTFTSCARYSDSLELIVSGKKDLRVEQYFNQDTIQTTETTVWNGSISGFENVYIDSFIYNYGSQKRTANSLKCTNLHVKNFAWIGMVANPTKVEVKNLFIESEKVLDSGNFAVSGDLKVTGLMEVKGKALFVVINSINIGSLNVGPLNDSVGSDLTFITGKDTKAGSKPRMTINGTVTTDSRIKIGVGEDGANAPYVFGEPGKNQVVLTAPKADVKDFELYDLCTPKKSSSDETRVLYNSTSQAQEDSYTLEKVGKEIKYVAGEEIGVVLLGGKISGFECFRDINGASARIDELNDSTGTYTIRLVNDTANVANAAIGAVKLPTKAAGLTIKSSKLASVKLTYTGNITLKCNTTFEFIEFSPVKDAKSVDTLSKSEIAAGKYTLTIKSKCTNTSADGTGITKISSTGGNISLNGFTVNGDLTTTGDFEGTKFVIQKNLKVGKQATITDACEVGGKSTIGTLFFTSKKSNTMTFDDTATIDNIAGDTTEYYNNLVISRDSKNNTGLIVNKDISDVCEYYITVKVPDGYSENDYSATIPSTADNYRLFTVKGYYNPDNLVVYIGKKQVDKLSMVRAGDGVYDGSFYNSLYGTVNVSDGTKSYIMMDWNEAVKKIDSLNNPNAEYTVLLTNSVCDPVITDSAQTVSVIKMPAQNKYRQMTVKPYSGSQANVILGGNNCAVSGNALKTFGRITFDKVVLKTKTPFAITHNKNKNDTAGSLEFNVYEAPTINKIAGSKNTSVKISDTLNGQPVWEFDKGITDVTDLYVDNYHLWLGQASNVSGKLTFNRGSFIVAQKSLSIGSFENNASIEDSFIGYVSDQPANADEAKLLAAKPLITITGQSVSATRIRVFQKDTTRNDNLDAKEFSETLYKEGLKLVVAKADAADNYIAGPFTPATMSSGNIICTKDLNGYVSNVDLSLMKCCVTNKVGNITHTTYCKSFDEAVKIIDTINDKTADYTITLFEDTKLTKFTAPKNAHEVTVTSNGSDNKIFSYPSGQMKTQGTCIFAFDAVNVSEWDKNSDKLPIKATLTKTSGIGFSENTATYKSVDDLLPTKGYVNVSQITGNGTVIFTNSMPNACLTINDSGNFQVGDVIAKINPVSKVVVDAKGTVTMNDVNTLGALYFVQYTTKAVREKSKTNMTINGRIYSGQLGIIPRGYRNDADVKSSKVSIMNNDDLMKIIAFEDGNLTSKDYQKLVNAPLAGTDKIVISNEGFNQSKLESGQKLIPVKYNGGIYATTYDSFNELVCCDETGRQLQKTLIPSWDQVSVEVDKAKQTQYSYTLLVNNEREVVKTVKMPSKCAKFTIKGNQTKTAMIKTTTATVKLLSDTVFDNAFICPVKAVGSIYVPVKGTYNTDKWVLTIQNTDAKEGLKYLGDIELTGKGTLIAKTKNEDIDFDYFSKITGLSKVDAQSNMTVKDGISAVTDFVVEAANPGTKRVIDVENSDFSVKNIEWKTKGTLYARNITVSQNTLTSYYYSNADFIEFNVTKNHTVGQGKITLNNVELYSRLFLKAKQDAKGNSMITVNGNYVDHALEVNLPLSIHVILYDCAGYKELTLKKGDVVLYAKKEIRSLSCQCGLNETVYKDKNVYRVTDK